MIPKFSKPSFDTRCYQYIGKVAEKTGASRKAIRLYEERGLIPAPERLNAYRLYSDQHVFMVHMIKQAQDVGFTLSELNELVGAVAQGETFPLELANQMVAMKQVAIATEITRLKGLRKRLDELETTMNQVFKPE